MDARRRLLVAYPDNAQDSPRFHNLARSKSDRNPGWTLGLEAHVQPRTLTRAGVTSSEAGPPAAEAIGLGVECAGADAPLRRGASTLPPGGSRRPQEPPPQQVPLHLLCCALGSDALGNTPRNRGDSEDRATSEHQAPLSATARKARGQRVPMPPAGTELPSLAPGAPGWTQKQQSSRHEASEEAVLEVKASRSPLPVKVPTLKWDSWEHWHWHWPRPGGARCRKAGGDAALDMQLCGQGGSSLQGAPGRESRPSLGPWPGLACAVPRSQTPEATWTPGSGSAMPDAQEVPLPGAAGGLSGRRECPVGGGRGREAAPALQRRPGGQEGGQGSRSGWGADAGLPRSASLRDQSVGPGVGLQQGHALPSQRKAGFRALRIDVEQQPPHCGSPQSCGAASGSATVSSASASRLGASFQPPVCDISPLERVDLRSLTANTLTAFFRAPGAAPAAAKAGAAAGHSPEGASQLGVSSAMEGPATSSTATSSGADFDLLSMPSPTAPAAEHVTGCCSKASPQAQPHALDGRPPATPSPATPLRNFLETPREGLALGPAADVLWERTPGGLTELGNRAWSRESGHGEARGTPPRSADWHRHPGACAGPPVQEPPPGKEASLEGRAGPAMPEAEGSFLQPQRVARSPQGTRVGEERLSRDVGALSSPVTWRELERTCAALDAAHIRISGLDLTDLTGSFDADAMQRAQWPEDPDRDRVHGGNHHMAKGGLEGDLGAPVKDHSQTLHVGQKSRSGAVGRVLGLFAARQGARTASCEPQ